MHTSFTLVLHWSLVNVDEELEFDSRKNHMITFVFEWFITVANECWWSWTLFMQYSSIRWGIVVTLVSSVVTCPSMSSSLNFAILWMYYVAAYGSEVVVCLNTTQKRSASFLKVFWIVLITYFEKRELSWPYMVKFWWFLTGTFNKSWQLLSVRGG